MKKLSLAALICAAVAAAGSPVLADDDGRDLVTVLTTPEPQTQLMAMILTLQAASQGSKGHVLLCGPAGDLALKDAPKRRPPRKNQRA